jgi:biotin carboxylase
MDKLMLLAPTVRERRDLPALAASAAVDLVFEPFDDDWFDRVIQDGAREAGPFDLPARIESATRRARELGVRGVTSAVGYPGMSATALIARELGLPGPNPLAVFTCEHKYYGRQAQARLVPEATPRFALAGRHASETPGPPGANAELDGIAFPAFVKPVKSCMSMHAHAVHDRRELGLRLANGSVPRAFVEPFNALLRQHTGWGVDAGDLMVEELLSGAQVSVEGYVQGCRARVLGIVDAVMHPGTDSFLRFVYPSALPAHAQAAIADVAVRLMEGLDYGDALFNIEMRWDPDTGRVGVIEVNPKIASQFPDLFEKVDGFSTYTTLMEVALGRPPSLRQGGGRWKLAASCVLRVFEDHVVHRVPGPADMAAVQACFPDARVQVFARPGRRLSQDFQDPHSFRYALVNLGADSEADLLERLEQCVRLLPFEMQPCGSS